MTDEKQELIKKTGIIQEVMPNTTGKNMYFIQVDGETYSGWGSCPGEAGEEITFKYIISGQYKNIKYVYQPEKEEGVQELEEATKKEQAPKSEVLMLAAVNLTVARAK